MKIKILFTILTSIISIGGIIILYSIKDETEYKHPYGMERNFIPIEAPSIKTQNHVYKKNVKNDLKEDTYAEIDILNHSAKLRQTKKYSRSEDTKINSFTNRYNQTDIMTDASTISSNINYLSISSRKNNFTTEKYGFMAAKTYNSQTNPILMQSGNNDLIGIDPDDEDEDLGKPLAMASGLWLMVFLAICYFYNIYNKHKKDEEL